MSRMNLNFYVSHRAAQTNRERYYPQSATQSIVYVNVPTPKQKRRAMQALHMRNEQKSLLKKLEKLGL